ncbi:MAG: acetylornithine deacetylase [Marmoricola sp.]|nr:acetylornithine deacetylase [Marmoricola sp.]
MQESPKELVARHLDEDRVLDLLRASIQTPSVTGSERGYADLLGQAMREMDFDHSEVLPFAEDRANVWGGLRGTGGGAGVMFLGHIDTVSVGDWAQQWAGSPREDPFGAVVVDGEMTGRGSADQKAGVVAAIMAMDLIKRSGVRLKGDVTGVFVADEEGGEPGSATGQSLGIKACVTEIEAGRIPSADFAVYTEPTTLQVYTAQMGFLTADITVHGESAYFGMPWLGRDALRQAHVLLSRLWDYSDGLWEAARHPLIERPFVLVTGVQAGGLVAVPGEAVISLIQKILPGQSLDEAQAGLDDLLKAAAVRDGIQATIEYTSPRDHPAGGTPAELIGENPHAATLQRALRTVAPDRGGVEGAPYWSEMSFTQRQLGIPTVYCGPGDISCCHTADERVSVREVIQATEAFALFILETCGVEPEMSRTPSKEML